MAQAPAPVSARPALAQAHPAVRVPEERLVAPVPEGRLQAEVPAQVLEQAAQALTPLKGIEGIRTRHACLISVGNAVDPEPVARRELRREFAVSFFHAQRGGIVSAISQCSATFPFCTREVVEGGRLSVSGKPRSAGGRDVLSRPVPQSMTAMPAFRPRTRSAVASSLAAIAPAGIEGRPSGE